MSIYRTNPVQRLRRIEEETAREEEKRNFNQTVEHEGHSWTQGKENKASLVKPTPIPKTQERNYNKLKLGDPLKKYAKSLLENLMTIEAKVAQLCFYETKATYDESLQHFLEILVQTWQVGGIFFSEGDYKRQSYVVERLQELTKTPLLIGNDFLHALSFYSQETHQPLEEVLKKQEFEHYYCQLGEDIVALNRRLGVHFQLIQEDNTIIDRLQRKAFCKGLSQAKGIIGKYAVKRSRKDTDLYTQRNLNFQMPLSLKEIQPSLLSENQMSELVGDKQLSLYDLRNISPEEWSKCFKEHSDGFLFSQEQIPQAIKLLSKAVRQGCISEEELDKRIFKMLLFKSFYFASSSS